MAYEAAVLGVEAAFGNKVDTTPNDICKSKGDELIAHSLTAASPLPDVVKVGPKALPVPCDENTLPSSWSEMSLTPANRL